MTLIQNPKTERPLYVPDDIADLKPWFPVIRRLKSKAKNLRGYTGFTITVILDSVGNPIYWTAPVRTELEPKHKGPGELGGNSEDA